MVLKRGQKEMVPRLEKYRKQQEIVKRTATEDEEALGWLEKKDRRLISVFPISMEHKSPLKGQDRQDSQAKDIPNSATLPF